jgi:hypothetical protein
MQTATLVVIVNYRTAALVVDCLRSLQDEVAKASRRFGPVSVIVVDNASGDGSPDQIEEAIASRGWANWAQLRRLPRNGGFAWGNNAAIRHASESDGTPDFVWLLNPDTIVRPGALVSLLEFLQSHPQAGLAGSRLEDPDGTVQRSAFRFPSLPAEVDNGLRLGLATRLLARRVVAPEPPGEATPTDWLSGASLMIRWAVIQEIGLLDEGYFMYFEETDFCRRAYRAGWRCWYVPQSRVVHLVGQASGINAGQQNKRRADYWFHSRRRYFLKHLGKIRTAAADGLFMIGFATWRLRRRLQKKADPDPAMFLSDFARWSVWRRGFRLNG